MKQIILFLAAITVSLTACTHSANNSTEKLNVMSFNLRYDNPDDAPNNWDNRKEWVADMINFYSPDVFGMQEVLIGQLNDLRQLLPEYAVIGRGRDDGRDAGEFSPIFYKKDKFQLVEDNTSWLSETPEVPGSLGWDAACNRVLTKGVFKFKASGRQITIYNTHFDHMGVVARNESALMVKDVVKQSSERMPVVVMGDFNAAPSDNVYRQLTEESPLTDARLAATKSYGPEWTFHDFGRLPAEEREYIDYIFVTSNLKVNEFVNFAEQRADRFLSDHNPIFAEVEFK